jgi:hypothetical protein
MPIAFDFQATVVQHSRSWFFHWLVNVRSTEPDCNNCATSVEREKAHANQRVAGVLSPELALDLGQMADSTPFIGGIRPSHVVCAC